MTFKLNTLILISILICNTAFAQTQVIKDIIEENYDYLDNLYKYFHAHPELSLQEKNTSKRLANELRELGFTVTENVGGYGIAGILKNGDGPVVMVRSDMDALPMKEETGVSFASTQIGTTLEGEETYVMHACGHDMHMTVMVGTAKVLAELKDQWRGTLVFIGQPAEELLSGARAMIEDGLFERFPIPDYMLALHVNSAMESGKVGFSSGFAYANVDLGEIIVRGRGGHGAYPDLSVDPIVIASKIVLDLQTLISREVSALDPVSLSIGSIRGGSSANIIPGEVVMEVALYIHRIETRERLIRRITEKLEGTGMGTGLPEEYWPRLILDEKSRVSSVYNDPELGIKLEETFNNLFGEENVLETPPFMYGEDFGEYNNARPEIPGVLFGIGSISPEDMANDLTDIPSTHSPEYLPDFEPTLKTGILAMSGAVLELLAAD